MLTGKRYLLDSVPAVGPVVTPTAAAGCLQENTRNSVYEQSDPSGAPLYLPAAPRVGSPSASCCSSATGFKRQTRISPLFYLIYFGPFDVWGDCNIGLLAPLLCPMLPQPVISH